MLNLCIHSPTSTFLLSKQTFLSKSNVSNYFSNFHCFIQTVAVFYNVIFPHKHSSLYEVFSECYFKNVLCY